MAEAIKRRKLIRDLSAEIHRTMDGFLERRPADYPPIRKVVLAGGGAGPAVGGLLGDDERGAGGQDQDQHQNQHNSAQRHHRALENRRKTPAQTGDRARLLALAHDARLHLRQLAFAASRRAHRLVAGSSARFTFHSHRSHDASSTIQRHNLA